MNEIYDEVFSKWLADFDRRFCSQQADDEPWGDINAQTLYSAQMNKMSPIRETLTPRLPKAKRMSSTPMKSHGEVPEFMKTAPVDEEIEAKMDELEEEQEMLTKAKATAQKIKTQIETRKRQYGRIIKDLQIKQQKGEDEINKWKEQELAKIQKEEKQRKDNQRRISMQPSKKDRAKINDLQEQIQKTTEEMKHKTKQHKLIEKNLKKKLDDMTLRQKSLMQECIQAGVENVDLPRSKHLGQAKAQLEMYGLELQQTPEPAIRRSASQAKPSQKTSKVANRYNANDKQFIDLYMDDESEIPVHRVSPTITPVRQHPKPEQYPTKTKKTNQDDEIVEQLELEDGRQQFTYASGLIRAVFPNGNVKQQTPDGKTEVKFVNGDTLLTEPDGTQTYTYAETGTVQKNMANGIKILTFDNGQQEMHYPDGTREVTFPDGLIKQVSPDGEEVIKYP